MQTYIYAWSFKKAKITQNQIFHALLIWQHKLLIKRPDSQHRRESICSHLVYPDEFSLMVVNDLSKDESFKHLPYIAGPSNYRCPPLLLTHMNKEILGKTNLIVEY
jgi:hypothetical protein